MSEDDQQEGVRNSVFQMLTEEGFRPKWTDDGDLTVKYQGTQVWIEWHPDDEDYTRILVPNFWPIESPEELQQAFRAASHVSHKCKGVKLAIVDETNVWASVEFVASPADIASSQLMMRRLIMLDHGVDCFRSRMRQLSEASADAPAGPGCRQRH